jgi:hypothetical protein
LFFVCPLVSLFGLFLVLFLILISPPTRFYPLFNSIASLFVLPLSKPSIRENEHFPKVLPDYQCIGIGKRLLNFIAELYTNQINLPFYLVTSNPQLVRGNLGNWRAKRVGHSTSEQEDTKINSELTKSNSKRRPSVTLKYIPSKKRGE